MDDQARFAGMWMATDAQHRTRPVFLDDGTWSVVLGNPHLRLDGATRVEGWYRAFLPETLLAASGTSSEEVAQEGLDVLLGVDSVGASISRVTGGILIKIPQVHYSTSRFTFGGAGGTQVIGPPDPPGGLTALPIDGGAVLEFPPTMFDGGSPVTGYTARCTADGHGTVTVASARAGVVSVTGLENGEIWACDVQAHNASSDSDWTASVSAAPALGAKLGSIEGHVFDGSDGVPGVIVFLERSPANGVFDIDEVSVTTAEGGGFLFGDLAAGEYTVELVVPDGYASAGPRPATVTVPEGDPVRADFSVRASDRTPPVITHQVSGELGNDDWYRSAVTVSFSVADAESQFSTAGGCEEQVVTSDTSEVVFECTAVSEGGSSTDRVVVKRDATPPTLEPSVDPNPVVFGGVAAASPGADDAMSGIAGGSCEAPDTSSVGLKILTCSATDRAGNTTVAEVEYQVAEFPFAGFFSPVDNQPVFNVVKAGSAVPVKFSLAGDRGFDIFQTEFPGSGATSCDVTQPLDGIEEIVRDSQSGLHYDVATGQYIYVWKTDKAWAGRCRVLTLTLSDGTVHQANFKFTKN